MMRRKMENTNESLTKQKEILQSACRRASIEIKELKDTVKKLEKIAALTSNDVIDKLRDADARINDYTEGK